MAAVHSSLHMTRSLHMTSKVLRCRAHCRGTRARSSGFGFGFGFGGFGNGFSYGFSARALFVVGHDGHDQDHEFGGCGLVGSWLSSPSHVPSHVHHHLKRGRALSHHQHALRAMSSLSSLRSTRRFNQSTVRSPGAFQSRRSSSSSKTLSSLDAHGSSFASPSDFLDQNDEADSESNIPGMASSTSPSASKKLVNYADGMSDEQLKAVLAPDGAVSVKAGPGSGKTRVLAARAAHLVTNEGFMPWQVLCITFTRKAAGELRDRLKTFLGAETASRVHAGTFHSVCARILRREVENRLVLRKTGRTADFVVFDAGDSIGTMRQVLEEQMFFTPKQSLETAPKLISRLGRERSFGEMPIMRRDEVQLYVEAKNRYERALIASNAFDFDQLLSHTSMLLRDDPDALRDYRERWPHILVDEFQDTNSIQYDIVARLAGARSTTAADVGMEGGKKNDVRASSLFVVGDTDQAIYGWRGANVENMRVNLSRDFPAVESLHLSANYRSTPQVVRAASGVLSGQSRGNLQQSRANFSIRAHRPSGLPVHVGSFDDDVTEADAISREAMWLAEHRGVSYSDMAVLYRTNRQARSLEAAMASRGVPHIVVGSTSFFQKKEVKDVLSYLRLASNPHDTSSFARVLNVPPRGLGPKALDEVKKLAAKRGMSAASMVLAFDGAAWEPKGELAEAVGARVAKGIRDFRDIVQSVAESANRGDDASDVVRLAIDRSGFRDWLLPDVGTSKGKKMSKDKLDENMKRWSNLDNLVDVARGVQAAVLDDDDFLREDVSGDADENGGSNTLADFLERIAVFADDSQDADEKDDQAVRLMTLHSAKGLEFDVVFLCGMNEGLLPHAISLNDDDGIRSKEMRVNEERNLAFVGITRAKSMLYLTHHKTSSASRFEGSDALPSRFLDDALRGLKEVGVGDDDTWFLYQ
ncbi:ATP-dependent DNA helicase PcrA [Pycnococcus provasolii]